MDAPSALFGFFLGLAAGLLICGLGKTKVQPDPSEGDTLHMDIKEQNKHE